MEPRKLSQLLSKVKEKIVAYLWLGLADTFCSLSRVTVEVPRSHLGNDEELAECAASGFPARNTRLLPSPATGWLSLSLGPPPKPVNLSFLFSGGCHLLGPQLLSSVCYSQNLEEIHQLLFVQKVWLGKC